MEHKYNDPQCPALKAVCSGCNRIGHYRRKCRSSTSQFKRSYQSTNNYSNKKFTHVHSITSDQNEETKFDPDFKCYRVDDSGKYKDLDNDEEIMTQIGGVSIGMVIDSGCKFNMINGLDYGKLCLNNAKMFNVTYSVHNQFKAYASDSNMKILLKFDAEIKLQNGNSEVSTFYVVENGDRSLLGKISSKQLGVLKVGFNINKIKTIDEFPKIRNVIVKLKISDKVKPVVQPYRRIPIALEENIEKKLNEALAMGIIEEVDKSEWVSPIVIVLKDD